MAGPGESESLPATEVSNKWHGPSFAARLPDPTEDGAKAERIVDPRIVGDPGPTRQDWEAEATLRVVKASSRPDFDPRGLTTRELRLLRKAQILGRARVSLQGRQPRLELAASDSGLPLDAGLLLDLLAEQQVDPDTAHRALARRGWAPNAVARAVAARQTAAATRNPVLLRATLQGSRRQSVQVPLPDTLTCAAFHPAIEGIGASRAAGDAVASWICLVGGSNGLVYRFRVSLKRQGERLGGVPGDLDMPVADLTDAESLHAGGVWALQVPLHLPCVRLRRCCCLGYHARVCRLTSGLTGATKVDQCHSSLKCGARARRAWPMATSFLPGKTERCGSGLRR
jgi:hypothetical protein